MKEEVSFRVSLHLPAPGGPPPPFASPALHREFLKEAALRTRDTWLLVGAPCTLVTRARADTKSLRLKCFVSSRFPSDSGDSVDWELSSRRSLPSPLSAAMFRGCQVTYRYEMVQLRRMYCKAAANSLIDLCLKYWTIASTYCIVATFSNKASSYILIGT